MAATKVRAQFTPDLFTFFKSLKRNNSREWFTKHKDRYESVVKEPMQAFIEAFEPKLNSISRHFIADSAGVGGSMFRINRDVRFSKDKSPYKTHASAQFRHEQGKDVHAPGFYLHLEPGDVFAAAGLWHPDTKSANAIRQAIVDDPKEWRAVLNSQAFRDGRLKFAGESLKRPPRGVDVDGDHPLIEDIKRKDFIVVCPLTERKACAGDFVSQYASICRGAKPLMKFLTEAVGLPF